MAVGNVLLGEQVRISTLCTNHSPHDVGQQENSVLQELFTVIQICLCVFYLPEELNHEQPFYYSAQECY
jgi:hypothetical protein